MYFDVDGRQIKGKSISDEKGLVHYYDAESGELQLTWKFLTNCRIPVKRVTM
ncbi:hypothetical protein, partial [Oenococcus oeni]|uniref:hypothetical protein n=1 Tax=Oenococcus oeni TaxID=1247 RepID=UPI0039C9EB8F